MLQNAGCQKSTGGISGRTQRPKENSVKFPVNSKRTGQVPPQSAGGTLAAELWHELVAIAATLAFDVWEQEVPEAQTRII